MEDILWDKFEKSGSVSDYLAYTREKKEGTELGSNSHRGDNNKRG